MYHPLRPQASRHVDGRKEVASATQRGRQNIMTDPRVCRGTNSTVLAIRNTFSSTPERTQAASGSRSRRLGSCCQKKRHEDDSSHNAKQFAATKPYGNAQRSTFAVSRPAARRTKHSIFDIPLPDPVRRPIDLSPFLTAEKPVVAKRTSNGAQTCNPPGDHQLEPDCGRAERLLQKTKESHVVMRQGVDAGTQLSGWKSSQPHSDSVSQWDDKSSSAIPKSGKTDESHLTHNNKNSNSLLLGSSDEEDADLFDFNLEVTGLVEELSRKVAEQALTELYHEGELEKLKDEKSTWRDLEKAREDEEDQRMAEERRKVAELSKKIAEAKRRVNLEAAASRQQMASETARCGVESAVTNALDSLKREGVFASPETTYLEQFFLPLLDEECRQHLKKREIAQQLLHRSLLENNV